MNRRKKAGSRQIGLLIAIIGLLTMACGGPPQEALDGAENALLDAAWAEECAADTYRAAQKMLAEAKQASADGNYDEAERKAKAAMKLADQARGDAELNKEECERRKAAVATIEDTFDDKDKGMDVNVNEQALQTVYFDFDQSEITTNSQSTINENASWMKSNGTSKIRIEGHTDSRGSTEYNLALSQRRAQVIKRYLLAMGIEGDRMKVVPYGEERPASDGSSESDHAKNRRAEFIPY